MCKQLDVINHFILARCGHCLKCITLYYITKDITYDVCVIFPFSFILVGLLKVLYSFQLCVLMRSGVRTANQQSHRSK